VETENDITWARRYRLAEANTVVYQTENRRLAKLLRESEEQNTQTVRRLSELEEILKFRDQTNGKLVDERDKALRDARDIVGERNAQIEELQSMLRGRITTIDQMMTEKEQMLKRIEILEEDLWRDQRVDDREKEHEDLKDKSRRQEMTMAALVSERDQYHLAVSSLKKRNDDQAATIAVQSKTIADLTKVDHDMLAGNVTVGAEVAGLTSERDALLEYVAQLEKRQISLCGQADLWAGKYHEANQNDAKLTKNVADLENERNELLQFIAELEGRHASLYLEWRGVAGLKKELRELEKRHASLYLEWRDLEKERNELRERVDDLESDVELARYRDVDINELREELELRTLKTMGCLR
jgi:chromosome segregation ATPase